MHGEVILSSSGLYRLLFLDTVTLMPLHSDKKYF